MKKYKSNDENVSIKLVSVRCKTGKNQDCAILVLLAFISNFRNDLDYETILQSISRAYADFGLKYTDKEQIGADMFEGVLKEFLPDTQIEFYNIIYKPNQQITATMRLFNKEGKEKTPYRLALLSSWDHNLNTVGAGHYVILNTSLASSKEILQQLQNRQFEETYFNMASCIQCLQSPVFFREEHVLERTFCNTICQQKFYTSISGKSSRETQRLQYVDGNRTNIILDLKTGLLTDVKNNSKQTTIPKYALEQVREAFDLDTFHKHNVPQSFVGYIYNDDYIAYPEEAGVLDSVFQNNITTQHTIHQTRMRLSTSGFPKE